MQPYLLKTIIRLSVALLTFTFGTMTFTVLSPSPAESPRFYSRAIAGTALERQALSLTDKLHSALLEHDTEALQEILADDFVLINPHGRMKDKERIIADLSNPDIVTRRLRKAEEVEVEIDNVVVILSH